MTFLKYCVLVIVVFCTTFSIEADRLASAEPNDAAEVYNHAGSLYRDGEFQKSLAEYETLISRGIKHPDLYYNASNAAYRSGQLGKAVLYIERCLLLAPSDKDALANRTFLKSLKKDQEPESGNVFIVFIARWYDSLNVNATTLLSGIFFALSLCMATACLFMTGSKRLVLLLLFVGMSGVSCISGGISVHKAHRAATQIQAVIQSGEAKAYSGPDVENTHIFTIHEGTKVIIERQQDDWFLIRLHSGAGGWIPSGHLEII